MKDATGVQDLTGTIAAGDPPAAEGRNGPTWRGWVLSILLAIILSVTATLLLGDSSAFQADRAVAAGAGGFESGTGSGCCPHASAEK